MIIVFMALIMTKRMSVLTALIIVPIVLALLGGFGPQHISKGYIYFAMGFSMFVETLNIKVRKSASRRSNCVSLTPIKGNRRKVQ